MIMRKHIPGLSKSASKILRERLKEEAIINAERDLAIVALSSPVGIECLPRGVFSSYAL